MNSHQNDDPIHIDMQIRWIRDAQLEDSVLDVAIDMLSDVANHLNDVRQIPLA